MAYTGTAYGDITPRQAAFSIAGFLSRAIPQFNLILQHFCVVSIFIPFTEGEVQHSVQLAVLAFYTHVFPP